MIKHCTNCGNTSHTQDKLHGKGRRVFNVIETSQYTERRCTVCGTSEKIIKGK